MVKAQAITPIHRDMEQVLRYVSVGFFKEHASWSPEVPSPQQSTPGPVRLGTAARQIRSHQGRRAESTSRVEDYRKLRRIAFTSPSRPKLRVIYALKQASIKIRMTFPFNLYPEMLPRAFEGLIAGAVRSGTEQVVRNSNHLLEAEREADNFQPRLKFA